MARRSGIHWYYDTLTPRMAIFTTLLEEGVEEYLEREAEKLQEYAQENAPWEDRTGAARDGLTAEYHQDGHTHFIDLFHTVEYGIWLEIRWNGRYAIIEPAVREFAPRIMANMSFQELFSGD